MSRTRFLNRKLKLESLDRRCVMDAEGIELPADLVVIDDSELATPEEIRTMTGDDTNVEDVDIKPDDMAEPVSIEDADVIFQTFGGSINVAPARNWDVNGSGSVTPLDALTIINAISRMHKHAGAEGTSRATLATSVTNGDALDVNQDSQITPYDALLVINQLARQRMAEANALDPIGIVAGDGTGDVAIGRAQLNYDAILEADPEGSKSLTLADFGPYGIVTLTLDSKGLVSAEADGEAKVVTVAEDGTLVMDDLTLPAFVFTGSNGAQGLFNGFGSRFDEFPGDNQGIAVGEFSRMAGALMLTVVGVGDSPIVVSVTESNEITALSNGETLDVTVGDDGILSIGDQRLPISILKLENTILLVPQPTDSEDVSVSWPMAVDDVMASFA